ncbi:MAG: polymer-forming cytoskeletal protein [Verrucomicrobia bacterium]|nr:polymer-forming cytoskeletal protein [Verrucomicrobiota bacterium]
MRLVIYCFFLTFFCLSSLKGGSEEYDVVLDEVEVAIPRGEVFEGTYCSLGDCVIEGTVKGNAYLLGAETDIAGTIEGDLIIIGGNVSISGAVTGNVHIFAGQAILEGNIGGDLMFIGANLLLPGPGVIGGDLLIIGGNSSLDNKVCGNVTALIASFTISGSIDKNLRSFVDKLRIVKSAKVLGSLTYRSRNKVVIDSGAEIVGPILHKSTFIGDVEGLQFFRGAHVGMQVFPFLVKFFYTFIVGCLLILFFPYRLRSSIESLQRYPGKSFVYGLAMLIILPILTGVLLVTVIGAPFALTVLALNIISFYTVTVFPILWMSNAIFKKLSWKGNTIRALIVGQGIYYCLTMIPIFGMILACMTTVLGFGATVVAQAQKH